MMKKLILLMLACCLSAPIGMTQVQPQKATQGLSQTSKQKKADNRNDKARQGAVGSKKKVSREQQQLAKKQQLHEREYNAAKRRYDTALGRVIDAERKLNELTAKQKEEQEELEAKQARERKSGINVDLVEKQKRERTLLSTKQAGKLLETQQALDKARKEYESASERLDEIQKKLD